MQTDFYYKKYLKYKNKYLLLKGGAQQRILKIPEYITYPISYLTSGLTSDLTSGLTSGLTSDLTSDLTSGLTSGLTSEIKIQSKNPIKSITLPMCNLGNSNLIYYISYENIKRNKDFKFIRLQNINNIIQIIMDNCFTNIHIFIYIDIDYIYNKHYDTINIIDQFIKKLTRLPRKFYRNVTIINHIQHSMYAIPNIYIEINGKKYKKFRKIMNVSKKPYISKSKNIKINKERAHNIIYLKSIWIDKDKKYMLYCIDDFDDWLLYYTKINKKCSYKKIFQSSGTCWVNAVINLLCLSPDINIEIKSYYESLQLLKTDELILNETQIDGIQTNETQIDEIESETKLDTSQSDTTKLDTLQSDTKKLDTLQSDTTKLDTSQSDTTKLDTLQSDTTKLDTLQSDTKKLDTLQSDTKKLDTSQSDTTKLDEPQIQEIQEIESINYDTNFDDIIFFLFDYLIIKDLPIETSKNIANIIAYKFIMIFNPDIDTLKLSIEEKFEIGNTGSNELYLLTHLLINNFKFSFLIIENNKLIQFKYLKTKYLKDNPPVFFACISNEYLIKYDNYFNILFDKYNITYIYKLIGCTIHLYSLSHCICGFICDDKYYIFDSNYQNITELDWRNIDNLRTFYGKNGDKIDGVQYIFLFKKILITPQISE